MKKMIREKADLSIALRSRARRSSGADTKSGANEHIAPQPRFSLGRVIKSVLRKTARGMYVIFLRPFVRPLARRLGAYLNMGRSDELVALKTEIMTLQGQFHERTHAETHAVARTIVDVMEARHETVRQDIRRLRQDMTQDWQLVRDFVKHDLHLANIAATERNQAIIDQLRGVSAELRKDIAGANRGSAREIKASITQVLDHVDAAAAALRRDVVQAGADRASTGDVQRALRDILDQLQSTGGDLRQAVAEAGADKSLASDVREGVADILGRLQLSTDRLQHSIVTVSEGKATETDVRQAANTIGEQLHASVATLQQGLAAAADGRASTSDVRLIAADIAAHVQAVAADIRADVTASATDSASAEEVRRAADTVLTGLQAVSDRLHRGVAETSANKASASDVQKAVADILSRLDIAATDLKKDLSAGATAFAGAQETLQSDVRSRFPQLDRIETYGYTTARRLAIPSGSEDLMVRTLVGYVMCKATDSAVVALLMETGDLELGTRLLIQSYLKPGETFIDVGANLGLHTLAAARAMQGKGKIVCFEPYGPTRDLLERTVWLNGFSGMIDIHQAAVTRADAERQLFLGATSGHHSVFPLGDGSDGSSVNIRSVRLDSVVSPRSIVDLIKIDVEGAELDVLDSAASLIAGNSDIALIVEFGPPHLRRLAQTPDAWFAAFAALGLAHKAINPASGALEEWSRAELDASDSINLFFAKPGSMAWEKAGVQA